MLLKKPGGPVGYWFPGFPQVRETSELNSKQNKQKNYSMRQLDNTRIRQSPDSITI